ncbi:Expansin-A23 [Vitis vinifera]|uniref:Expansin n=1 Tax=Vitis vinifera TaxID=29760 RepID=A0A438EBU6_VITVI|nr:Expansin-A23 [Vitis vinifera]
MAGSHFLLGGAMFTALLLLGLASSQTGWYDAHATFYGDMQGNETMQGACGYGDLFKQGYGLETTALSTALFDNGLSCGACFEIKCVNDPQWCIPDAGTITVTATNFCPPNYSKPTGNWCNPPLQHFDLSMPMFVRIAKYKAGIIPVQYRRIKAPTPSGFKCRATGTELGGRGGVVGQSLSFQVTTRDQKMVQSDNVAPADWKFGQTFEGKSNF